MRSQNRFLATLAALTWGVSLTLALPVHVSAQVNNAVPDAPISFWNATDMDLTVQAISVVTRNGQATPVYGKWDFKPGACHWLQINNQKVPGVKFSFILHTPGRASNWTVACESLSHDGYFRVDFTKAKLQTHFAGGAGGERRQFLFREIARLQSAIQQDQQLLTRQDWAAPIFRIGGELLGGLLENSNNEVDRQVAPVGGPILRQGGRELGNQVDRARAATEARIQANRQLLQRYTDELNAAPVVQPPGALGLSFS